MMNGFPIEIQPTQVLNKKESFHFKHTPVLMFTAYIDPKHM
jgi:hypothetical protein